MHGRDESAWKAVVFDPSLPEARRRLSSLHSSGEVWAVQDTLSDQLLALAETRHPDVRSLPPAKRQPVLESLVQEYLDGRSSGHIGRWIFYPWSGQLVHVLDPEAFRELRLDRNRNKITREEQQRLRSFTIGIVGLSVGDAVALTLAMEGVGGHFKLADFDDLELTNMNRLRAGCHELGLPKTVLAARQIAELDPWMEVSLFSDGIQRENIEEFFCAEPSLDVLVEECDSVDVKLLLREQARALRVPVVMETSDRGVLDVERFDQEPDQPLMPGVSSDSRAALSSGEKFKHILKFVGVETISPRLGASLLEIERTIATWPQLVSDVVLGGATVAVALRKLALGQPLPSGRCAIDLQERLTHVQWTTPFVAPAPEASSSRAEPGLAPLLGEILRETGSFPSRGTSPVGYESQPAGMF